MSASIVDQAEKFLARESEKRRAAEAESAARVDRLRRAFEAALDEHLMRFGFDRIEAQS